MALYATLRLSAIVLACVALASARPGDSLIGTKPSAWEVCDWMNSPPLTLKNLSGKVVLVRWWMAPGCPWCAATAPALNEFHKAYKDRGLVVIGFYHHKSSEPCKVENVKAAARKFRFAFPIAIDADWRTLKRWWMTGAERKWTSVTFLIDRHGVIRHIHPGGSYIRGDKGYTALKAKIEELLKEK